MFWERNEALNTCIEHAHFQRAKQGSASAITAATSNLWCQDKMRYLFKHSDKKTKTCNNIFRDTLAWLLFQRTALFWKAHLWKLLMSNQWCQNIVHFVPVSFSPTAIWMLMTFQCVSMQSNSYHKEPANCCHLTYRMSHYRNTSLQGSWQNK